MEEQGDRIKDQLAKAYKISKKDFSWYESYGEKTAFEYLIDASIQEVTLMKIQQQEAKKRGLIDGMNYKDFKEAWRKENALREEKIKNQQIVYGPSQYEEKQYYEYVMNNVVIQLKKYIGEHELDITEEEINQVYNLHKDYFLNEPIEQVKNNVALLIVEKAYEEQMAELLKGAQINYINKEGIKEIKKEWGK